MTMQWIDSGDNYCDVCAPHVERLYPGGVGEGEMPPFHPLCNCKVKDVGAEERYDILQKIWERAEARRQREIERRVRNEKGEADCMETIERVRLEGAGDLLPDGMFEVALISEGVAIGHGWEFGRAALAASVPLWDRAECFVDHSRLGAGRSVRDLAGIFHAPRFDEASGAVVATLKVGGPSGALLTALGREMLAEGDVKPRVGFSADVGFVADGKKVRQIQKVFSVDLVYNPARGGAFVRALNSVDAAMDRGEDVKMDAVAVTPAAVAAGNSELDAVRALLDVQKEQALLAAQAEESKKVRAAMCGYLLDSGLAASKLPGPMVEHVRAQFAGKVFEPSELTTAIDGARKLVSSLTGAGAVAGVGVVRGMYSSEDQLQAAVDDLLGAERNAQHANLSVHKLRGIRDLYHMLTGDYDYHGGYYADRVSLATTADFAGLVKNALNKIVVSQWRQLGRAGYDWWQNIATVEHFDSLNSITGTLVGSVGTLPAVSEGAEYTELVIGDSPETASFVKYGGYIPLTLELIDRDETRKLKAYPRELANAAIRRISGLVAAVFTDNSNVGPTMADTGALFNNTAVTTAGGHANLLTTALGTTYAAWETVAAAVYNQPLLVKNATGYYGTGAKMALDPKFCLVPRALKGQAEALFMPRLAETVTTAGIAPSGQATYGGGVVPITVPEWTDATDWAAVCDPMIAPAIYVGERFGLMPEIFIAGDEQSPAVFSNDEHRMKVRHFCAVWVNDFRPLHKSNVS